MTTPKQYEVLTFISQHLKNHGYAPNYEEIAKAIGTSSKGSVSKHIAALEKQGYLAKNPFGARSIKLIKPLECQESEGIPLVGKIAAGKPIMAFTNIERIDLHQHLKTGPNSYLLEVQGDSMKDCGIFHGDWVLVQSTVTARNGQIVVALIDGNEATLKRFRKNRDATITLLPENVQMEPMTFHAKRVAVQGIVIAQIRRYS